MRQSEDTLDVFCLSYVRSSYNQFSGGPFRVNLKYFKEYNNYLLEVIIRSAIGTQLDI